MMKLIKKTMIILACTLLVLSLSGCKNKTASEAVEKHLKEIQKSPFNVTMWLTFKEEARKEVESLIKEFEYTLGEETDVVSNITEKDVRVSIKGYDIGPYVKKFLDNERETVLVKLHETYSYEEMSKMTEEDPEKFQELWTEADIAYFKEVMNECREAGKTYEKNDAMFRAYYNTSEKEWRISINGMIQQYVDYITDNLYTVLTEIE